MYCVTCRAVRSPALAVTEAESPHLETISPPGLFGLKEEARRNVVEILEKPERRSSDSSFTEALSFYAAREQPCAQAVRPLQHADGPFLIQNVFRNIFYD